MFDEIRTAIEKHAEQIARVRRQFAVTTSAKSVYPERWISYHFIRALTDAIADSSVVLDVPVSNSAKSRNDNHIDAMIFNDDVAVIAEFKRSWTRSHWNDLAVDVDRVQLQLSSIAARFVEKNRKFFAFYGIDAWLESAAVAWKSGTDVRRWALPQTFRRDGVQRDFVQVLKAPAEKKTADFDGYYLLFAFESLTLPATPLPLTTIAPETATDATRAPHEP